MTDIAELEQQISIHFSPTSPPDAKFAALQYLDAFSLRDDALTICQSVLMNSENSFAQLFALQTIKTIIRNHWLALEQSTREQVSLSSSIQLLTLFALI